MSESVEQAALRRAAGELNLIGQVLDAVAEMQHTNQTLSRGLESAYQQIGELHTENAELRDAMVALTNRIEAVYQAVRSPGEVGNLMDRIRKAAEE